MAFGSALSTRMFLTIAPTAGMLGMLNPIIMFGILILSLWQKENIFMSQKFILHRTLPLQPKQCFLSHSHYQTLQLQPQTQFYRIQPQKAHSLLIHLLWSCKKFPFMQMFQFILLIIMWIPNCLQQPLSYCLIIL